MPQQSVSLLVAVDVCPLFANQFVCYSSFFVFFFFVCSLQYKHSPISYGESIVSISSWRKPWTRLWVVRPFFFFLILSFCGENIFCLVAPCLYICFNPISALSLFAWFCFVCLSVCLFAIFPFLANPYVYWLPTTVSRIILSCRKSR